MPQHADIRQVLCQNLLIVRPLVAVVRLGILQPVGIHARNLVGKHADLALTVIHLPFYQQEHAALNLAAAGFPYAGENDQVYLASIIFECHKTHILLFFGQDWTGFFDQTTHHDCFFVIQLFQLVRQMRNLIINQAHICVQRVVRHIQSEQFLFPLQLLVVVCRAAGKELHLRAGFLRAAKQGQLSQFHRAEMCRGNGHQLFQ